MERIKKIVNIKILFIGLCLCLAIPSCLYIIKGNSIINLTSSFSFFINPSNKILTPQKIIETILFMGLWIGIGVCYIYFVRKSDNVFKTWKSVIIIIMTVAILFTIILPMTSTDIFYYIGTGWSDAHYKVNPYYTSVDDLIRQNEQASTDTMLLKMKGTWSNQKIVYGPIWPMVCRILSMCSNGNLTVALIIYKLFNLVLHFINSYIVYKMTGKSKKYTLMYALNSLVLFECLSNVHNEMLLIFFIILAMYYLISKKQILPAIIFLACGSAVKYVAILLAPFFVLYYYRQEKIQKKIAYSLLYGLIFLAVLILCYMPYIQDYKVLNGILDQQEKFANSFFTSIAIQNISFAQKLSSGFMIAYVVIYIIEVTKMLFSNKEYTWEEMMRKYNTLLLLFIFGTITNLQPWYIIWILPTLFWQKEQNQDILQKMTIISIISTIPYFLFVEHYFYGQFYIYILAILTLLAVLIQKKKTLKE